MTNKKFRKLTYTRCNVSSLIFIILILFIWKVLYMLLTDYVYCDSIYVSGCMQSPDWTGLDYGWTPSRI